MDVTGLADPYVKIYLLCNGQRIAKKKTHVKKRTLSPVFNESFAFDIPTNEVTFGFGRRPIVFFLQTFHYKRYLMELKPYFQGAGACLENISLELMLLDWDRVTKNEVSNLLFYYIMGIEVVGFIDKAKINDYVKSSCVYQFATKKKHVDISRCNERFVQKTTEN